jgi:hypothetical protein
MQTIFLSYQRNPLCQKKFQQSLLFLLLPLPHGKKIFKPVITQKKKLKQVQ